MPESPLAADANDLFQPLIDAVAAELQTDEAFFGPACCPVLVEKLSDFINQIDNALSTRTGMCAIVGVPSVSGGQDGDPIIPSVVIQVYENTLHNQGDTGTGKSARGTALRAFHIVRRMQAGAWGRLRAPAGRPFLSQISSGATLAFEVLFECGAVLYDE